MCRICRPVTYVFTDQSRTHLSGLIEDTKAARCTEIFAALTSADGYNACREEIGSDPKVGNAHP